MPKFERDPSKRRNVDSGEPSGAPAAAPQNPVGAYFQARNDARDSAPTQSGYAGSPSHPNYYGNDENGDTQDAGYAARNGGEYGGSPGAGYSQGGAGYV